MRAASTRRREVALVGSGSYLSAVATVFFLTLPLVVGALEAQLGEAGAGLVASVFLGTAVLVGLPAAALVGRFDARVVGALGFALEVLGLGLATAVVDAPSALAACLALAGAGSGVLFPLSFRVIGAAADREAAFGWKLVAEQLVGAGLWYAIATQVEGLRALLALLAVFAGVSALVLLVTPGRPTPAAEVAVEGPRTSRRFWVALGATFAFMVGLSGTWAFVELLGARRLEDAGLLASIGAANLLLGALGAAVAAVQGDRLGPRRPLVIGAVGVLLLFGGLLSGTAAGFVGFLLALDAVWNYSLAFLFSGAAAHDPANRRTAWLAPAVGLGGACGPAVAGVALEGAGEAVMLAGCAGLVIAALAVALAVSGPRGGGEHPPG